MWQPCSNMEWCLSMFNTKWMLATVQTSVCPRWDAEDSLQKWEQLPLRKGEWNWVGGGFLLSSLFPQVLIQNRDLGWRLVCKSWLAGCLAAWCFMPSAQELAIAALLSAMWKPNKQDKRTCSFSAWIGYVLSSPQSWALFCFLPPPGASAHLETRHAVFALVTHDHLC